MEKEYTLKDLQESAADSGEICLRIAKDETIAKACEAVLHYNDYYEMGLSEKQLVQLILAIAAVEIEHEPKKY